MISHTAEAPLFYLCKCLCCVSVRDLVGSSWLHCAAASGTNRCQQRQALKVQEWHFNNSSYLCMSLPFRHLFFHTRHCKRTEWKKLEQLHCVTSQDVPLCRFPGFYGSVFITSHSARFLPALLHVGISYWTNSKNAAVLKGYSPTWGDTGSLRLHTPCTGKTNRKQPKDGKVNSVLFSSGLPSTHPKTSKWKKGFFSNRDTLGHAVIGFQWQHNERKIVNPFVSPMPLPTPPPYFILKPLFILSLSLPFTLTHLRASQWTDVISRASRGHRWTPATVSLRCIARDTPLCTTVTCRTSQIQAAERRGYRERYLCVCIYKRLPRNMHTSEKAPRRVLQREGPLGQARLKDVKNAFSSSVCQCVSAGRGDLRWHQGRYRGFKADNRTNPEESGKCLMLTHVWSMFWSVLDLWGVVQPGCNRQRGSLFKYLELGKKQNSFWSENAIR